MALSTLLIRAIRLSSSACPESTSFTAHERHSSATATAFSKKQSEELTIGAVNRFRHERSKRRRQVADFELTCNPAGHREHLMSRWKTWDRAVVTARAHGHLIRSDITTARGPRESSEG